MKGPYGISVGEPHPIGATVVGDGVNFSLFSRSATAVELLLFDRYDDRVPRQVVPLDPRSHRTFDYWHAHVQGVGAGTVYGYRVHGPTRPRTASASMPRRYSSTPTHERSSTGRTSRTAALARPVPTSRLR